MSMPTRNGPYIARLIDSGQLPKPRWQERRELHRALQRAHELAPETPRAPPSRPTTGIYAGLCLLIGFPDKEVNVSAQQVEAFCNKAGYKEFGNHGSVRDYFHDVSAGLLEYTTAVAPVYVAKKPRSYYTAQDVEFGVRARELIVEALQFHIAAGFDFSKLTVDAQHGVYAINVLYAGDQGPNSGWGKGLWPHASRLTPPVKLAPGRIAADYQIAAMGNGLEIGVYCHENGHMLCDFPDLYPYDKQHTGVGHYCLMGLGAVADGHNPTQVSAYLKYRAGWGVPQPVKAGANAVAGDKPNEFLIHKRSESEYLIIELRRARDRDAALMTTGLAIWHIDEQGSNASPEEQPAGHQHPECVLIQADGKTQLLDEENMGDKGDLFNPTQKPTEGSWSIKWWDGKPALRIQSITAQGTGIGFAATPL